MTHEAQQAIANAIAFEAKKDAMRQKQSGEWCLSLTVAAADMDTRLMKAAMGTRYQCVLVEISDDESPVDHKGQDREKWRDLGPVQQAGMRCSEPIFWAFLEESTNEYCERGESTVRRYRSGDDDFLPVRNETEAAECVRRLCGVTSRKDLGKPSRIEARQRWHDLDNHYQAWKATQ